LISILLDDSNPATLVLQEVEGQKMCRFISLCYIKMRRGPGFLGGRKLEVGSLALAVMFAWLGILIPFGIRGPVHTTHLEISDKHC
jgi:hypothetical protein